MQVSAISCDIIEDIVSKVLLPASVEAWGLNQDGLSVLPRTLAVTANTTEHQEALGISVHWHRVRSALCPRGLACKEKGC